MNTLNVQLKKVILPGFSLTLSLCFEADLKMILPQLLIAIQSNRLGFKKENLYKCIGSAQFYIELL